MNKTDTITSFGPLPVVTGPNILNIKYFCTTKQGGCSSGKFDSLNLGFNTNDSDGNTHKNRSILSKNLPSPVLWLNQVHGSKVTVINKLIKPSDGVFRPDADAAVTNVPGQTLGVQTADCMPIVIAHNQGLCLGVVHAGWRGLVGGVIENTVQTLVNEYGVSPSNLVAWIGPCIHQDSFQVGLDVMQQFKKANSGYVRFFKADIVNGLNETDKWLLNLPLLASNKLSVLGVNKVYISSYCTYANDKLFYSYRRSTNTGRQAVLAWISL